MERFAVKRGLIKTMGGNAGLAKLATAYFDDINVDAEGVFTGSYGLLVKVEASYDDAGKLAVDVVQLKGAALGDFLESDEGPQKAMESRRRAPWESEAVEVNESRRCAPDSSPPPDSCRQARARAYGALVAVHAAC